MPYSTYAPYDWVNNITVVDESKLDHIEQGIKGNNDAVQDLDTRLTTTAGAATGAIPKALVDAKGDILVASANDIPARLPVGTDGQALVADSAQALGLKWAVPAGGGGGATDISYEGAHVPASSHDDGDIVIKDGVLYLAQRTTTQTPDPSLWGAVGPAPTTRQGELAYAEATATINVSTSLVSVLTLPSVTLDGATPIFIEFFTPLMVPPSSAAQANIILHLYDNGVSVGQIGNLTTPVANVLGAPVRVARRLTPSAGAHVFEIRVAASASGATIQSTTGAPYFTRISLASPAIIPTPGHLVPVSYGITLPTAPVDGQEAILVDSLTNPSYQWRFRWNAGSASAYKWEFVGGTPALASTGADETTTTATTWVDLATVGPSFVVPRAGDYEVLAQAGGYNNTANITAYIGVALGAGTPQVSAAQASDKAAEVDTFYSVVGRMLAVASGAEMRMRYYLVNVSTVHYMGRSLRVTPVRVA